MSAALALVLQLVAPTPQPTPTLTPPPQDWSTLPPLRLVQHLPPPEAISSFVRDEVAAGRCVTPTPGALSIELAIQVGEDGNVRRIVPRAIDCPTVEQYAAGLASRFLRRNIGDAEVATWHRLTLAFAW